MAIALPLGAVRVLQIFTSTFQQEEEKNNSKMLTYSFECIFLGKECIPSTHLAHTWNTPAAIKCFLLLVTIFFFFFFLQVEKLFHTKKPENDRTVPQSVSVYVFGIVVQDIT